jgi:hypothetical protein
MNWRPIFKLASLPYNSEEEFFARHNKCHCETNEPYVVKCLTTRPCIVRFKVLNDQSFYKFDNKSKPMNFSKQAIVQYFKYWSFIQPERSKREDLECKNCDQLQEKIDSLEETMSNWRDKF